jgi:hypothetical protein
VTTECLANNHGSPLFSHAFERFIEDYESGFKSVGAVDVGKFKSITSGLGEACFRPITETDDFVGPDVFEPVCVATRSFQHLCVESAEDEFVDLLLQACPVDKNKSLFWRLNPELRTPEFFDERKVFFRVWARLITTEATLKQNRQ